MMTIRQELEQDHKQVFDLVQKAFEKEVFSDHKEHFLVERIRHSAHFIPELSIVAELNGIIAGYILLSTIKIKNDLSAQEALALAPVAVLPDYHRKGIGTALIQYAHQKARALKFDVIIVLGHESYYPKFGYKMARQFGIKLPFDVPDENCMLIELTDGALAKVSGTVEYPQVFYEESNVINRCE